MRGDGRHRDVGDVLEGARKHRWKKGDAVTPENLRDVEELGEEEAARAVQKQAVFGDYPDHDYNQGLGDTPGASLMKQKLIGAVSKSAGASKTAREWYVSGAEWLRRELDQVHTVEQVAEFVEKWKVGVEGHWVQEEKYTAKELVNLLGGEDASAHGSSWGSTFFVQDHADTTPETRTYGGTSYTFNRAKEYQITGRALEQRGFSSIHRVQNADGTTSYQLARPLPRSQNFYAKAAFGLGGFGEFVDAAKALRSKDVKSNRLIRAIMKHGSIWEKDAPEARRIDKLPEAEGWKAVTGKEQGERVRPKRWERAFFGVRRTGGASVPAVVDGDSLRDTFGFRGVQYGNWVEQEARDHHLKQAHGALMDLADLVGVEPKALSHGGTLGLAFGARGHGAAAAHYEPSRAVINLTHTNGAGTFAHEWGHFLDNQLTDNPTGYVMKGPNESRPRMISEMDAPHADVDPKVVDAFHDVMGTILGEDRSPEARELRKRRTELLYQRKSFDGDSAAVHNAAVRTFNRDQENYWSKYPERRRQKTTTYSNHAAVLGDYWSRPHELFARAFESFIEDKLASQNRESSYLVSGTQTLYRLERTKGTRTAKNLEPYPQGAERQAINAAMEKLTDALSKTQALKKAMERLRIRLYALVAA